jgi:hypothetical protein
MATGFNLHDQWIGDVMPQSGVSVALGRNTADGHQPAVPLIEAHTQLLMLHDTLGSGILAYNADELRLELTPTTSAPSGTHAIVPSMYFDAYDNVGGNAITTTTGTVDIDTERTNSHPDIFVFLNDELQINMAGDYEFNLRITTRGLQSNRATVTLFLEQLEPGGTYTEVQGTRATGYCRNATNRDGTANVTCIIPVGVGDKFRMRAFVINNTCNQTPDGTSMTVKRLG